MEQLETIVKIMKTYPLAQRFARALLVGFATAAVADAADTAAGRANRLRLAAQRGDARVFQLALASGRLNYEDTTPNAPYQPQAG